MEIARCSVLIVCSLLALTVSASHAAAVPSPAQAYWSSVVPNSPMPAAIEELLTTVPAATKKRPFNVEAALIPPPWGFNWQLSADLSHPNTADFASEQGLRVGTSMDLHLSRAVKAGNRAMLHPRDSRVVPFSSGKLPEILTRFNVPPGSPKARAVAGTLEECERPAHTLEIRKCVDSLESMADFATTLLSTADVWAMSTTAADDKWQGGVKQTYTVAPPGADMVGNKSVVCHPMEYPYGVFYCHMTASTRVYRVPLVGRDGTKVVAMVACHRETGLWNPKHLAFVVLGSKPGTPVCHFLSRDTVVWTPAS